MGCLNSGQGFSHWFGNIHLSGPCNRRCYFCVGQHMMALDSENNLSEWPLRGIDLFVSACLSLGVKEINLTGTNTDPSLYQRTGELAAHLRERIPGLTLGIRTNGVTLGTIQHFDKGSFSITSTDADTYAETMGGKMPDIHRLASVVENKPWKINIVLTPRGLATLAQTIRDLTEAGFRSFNLREPYGQSHIGDPLAQTYTPTRFVHGMPIYRIGPARVCYWDVHYCHVESINLYASGRVSVDYPITRGHSETGVVIGQEHFDGHKRRTAQWVSLKTPA